MGQNRIIIPGEALEVVNTADLDFDPHARPQKFLDFTRSVVTFGRALQAESGEAFGEDPILRKLCDKIRAALKSTADIMRMSVLMSTDFGDVMLNGSGLLQVTSGHVFPDRRHVTYVQQFRDARLHVGSVRDQEALPDPMVSVAHARVLKIEDGSTHPGYAQAVLEINDVRVGDKSRRGFVRLYDEGATTNATFASELGARAQLPPKMGDPITVGGEYEMLPFVFGSDTVNDPEALAAQCVGLVTQVLVQMHEDEGDIRDRVIRTQ